MGIKDDRYQFLETDHPVPLDKATYRPPWICAQNFQEEGQTEEDTRTLGNGKGLTTLDYQAQQLQINIRIVFQDNQQFNRLFYQGKFCENDRFLNHKCE